MLRFSLFIFVTIIFCGYSRFGISADKAPNQPLNILLITADDLGFDDLSIHQNPIVSTPNLDNLAAQSVQFKDFAVSPVCSTTRASLLTGRHFYKTGVSGVHGGRDYLNRKETLISEMLKKTGYQTGLWGKWHLGKTEGYFPWDRGFDQGYYAELYRHQNSFGFLNGQKVNHASWVSEVVTDYAIEFMQTSQTQAKPFFAYASFLAPHEPWLAPDKFVVPYLKKGERPAIANLYGMVSEMDFHIGRLLTFVEQSGLAENTLVIFMSDNGPWWDSSNYGAMTQQEWRDRNPTRMKGNKGQTWQNGIRSPLFIKLGDTFTPNTVERFVNVNDILPTILEATNTPLPINNKPIDGQSFWAYLLGQTEGENTRFSLIASHDVVSDKPLFNQWTPIDAQARKDMHIAQQLIGLRNEQYKLIVNPAMDRSDYPQPVNNYLLFDMQNDPLESTNIFSSKPGVAKKMVEQLEQEFIALLQDPNSFSTPIYLIGAHQPISVINGFGPSRTSGNTQSKAHQLTGMKQKGDSADYDIEVQTANSYKVYIKQRNTDGSGLKVQISVQDQNIVALLNGELMQYLGVVTLAKGLSRVRLEVLSNNSIKPWTQITGLRRIILVPENSELDPAEYQLPN
jgi:arylsulfatase A-like enzyme